MSTQPTPEAGEAPEADELLTVEEVSTLFRVPAATLRYWRQHGQGPRSFKLGRRILYRRSDLTAWADEQYRRTASA